MRRTLPVALMLVVLAATLPARGAAAPPPENPAPPGQIVVTTVNAHQIKILGLYRFLALYELAKAFRFRPGAFDGGVAPPDVIVLQEMRPSNVEIFEKILNQRFEARYDLAGQPDIHAKILYNRDTVTLSGDPVVWNDVCAENRRYQFIRAIENETGASFVVAGMHVWKNYTGTGQPSCKLRNVQEMKRQLAAETAPVIAAGDFNGRAMVEQFECDPEETSEPSDWWLEMTSPQDDSRAFTDAVRSWHAVNAESMANEWTHEWKNLSTDCSGTDRFKRARIDYLFASGATVAQAHTDHPGWAGSEPGTRNPGVPKYSDHRFVWGRFILTGPPQVGPPAATPRAQGAIDLAWEPVEGAQGYVVYRANLSTRYNELQRLPATETTFSDIFTDHGRTYRYAVAATGVSDAQGLESEPAFATADARGPRVAGHLPFRAARGVDVRVTLRIRFDERVVPDSVTFDTVQLLRDGRPVGGRLRQESAKILTFNPYWPLRKGETYRVVVRGNVRDKLGNRGERYAFNFTTEEPPPRKKRRR